MTTERQASRSRLTATIQVARVIVIAGLGMSLLVLALAPLVMPGTYSWITHTTSESAAQGVEGAWLARLGFILFGLSVLLLTWMAREVWGRLGAAFHGAFGALMLATAVFSHRPWDSTMPYDRAEDLLHSITATALGFAFALGVTVVLLRRAHNPGRHRVLDLLALGAAIGIPVGMMLWPQYAGLLQRAMFLVGYGWYGAEALTVVRVQKETRNDALSPFRDSPPHVRGLIS